MSEGGMIKLAPDFGPTETRIWDGGRTKIVQILISHDTNISGLQFQYFSKDEVDGKDKDKDKEELVFGDRHGEFTGNSFDVVTLNYPMEQLTGIKVWVRYHSEYSGRVISLSFITNLRTHGPFGQPVADMDSDDQDIESYCYNLGECGMNQFGGFHGAVCYGMVSQIGIYMKPFTSLSCSSVCSWSSEGPKRLK